MILNAFPYVENDLILISRNRLETQLEVQISFKKPQ